MSRQHPWQHVTGNRILILIIVSEILDHCQNLLDDPRIRLNGASNCNIYRNSLRIRLSPVKSPIIRKYKNQDKRRSLYTSISTCNVKSCICCSQLNCKSTIRSTVNSRQSSIVNTTDLDWRSREVIYFLTCCGKG